MLIRFLRECFLRVGHHSRKSRVPNHYRKHRAHISRRRSEPQLHNGFISNYHQKKSERKKFLSLFKTFKD